tara:strand:+ start:1203 stop:1925 length:723 start_codon:yes stop_codon:yes gene_type:complete
MISQKILIEQLKYFGLRDFPALMVHASMRKLGPIEGGCDALIHALIQSLGPQGNLIMVLGADDEEPFAALTTEADEDMGVLPELFRQWPGVQVNDHAAARYAVLGPQADYLLNPTALHDYHGHGSVLERLTELQGAVLRLGADTDTVTLTHYAEYLADIADKRRVKLRYLRADSGEQWIESLDDSDGIKDWKEGDYFPQILLDYLAGGYARVGPIGNCTAELLPAQSFVSYARQWMERNL